MSILSELIASLSLILQGQIIFVSSQQGGDFHVLLQDNMSCRKVTLSLMYLKLVVSALLS